MPNAKMWTATHRDGCVFKEDIDIYDTMSAIVKYSNGVNMSYSLNAHEPIEGYRLRLTVRKGGSKCAITNGSRGR